MVMSAARKRKRYFDRVRKSNVDVRSALFPVRYDDNVCGFCSLEVRLGEKAGFVSGEFRCETCWNLVEQ